MKKIAIIGGGLSGITMLQHIIRFFENTDETIEIILYEKDPNNLAGGLPYHRDTPDEWLLNGPPANKFKLHPQGKTLGEYSAENYEFLRTQSTTLTKDELFPPRKIIRHYLEAELIICKQIAAQSKNINLIMLEQEVCDITSNHTYLKIITKSAENKFDYVFLCTGHLLPDNFQELKDSPNFIYSPWDIKKLQEILNTEDDTIHIVGGHLTSIDVAKWFICHGFKGNLVFVTRNPSVVTLRQDQRSPHQNSDSTEHKQRIKNAVGDLNSALNKQPIGSTILEFCTQQFWQACNIALENASENNPTLALPTKNILSYQLNGHNDWRNLIDSYQDFIIEFYVSGCYSTLWQALSKEAQLEFKQQFYSHIIAWVSGIPPINARFLIELYEHNHLTEITGLTHIEYNQEQAKYLLHFANGTYQQATHIINATGTGINIQQLPANHLLTKLAKNDLIEATQFGFTVKPDYPNLVAIGPKPVGDKPELYASFVACAEAEQAVKKLFSPANIDLINLKNQPTI